MCEAPVGHTVTHSGLAQCWQETGRKYMSMSGQLPPSSRGKGPWRSTLLRKEPTRTSFTVLQATMQPRQPTQRFRSVTIVLCAIAYASFRIS